MKRYWCAKTQAIPVYTTLRRTRGLGPISDPSGKGIKVHTALWAQTHSTPGLRFSCSLFPEGYARWAMGAFADKRLA
ncbi:MAG: hypothetical protein ICV55_13525 [Coleofasciculus sp. C3-bin4]|nr:hypothetical protein [Coleofasciculus sp. C3-bin4]